ncbi:GntR family transcriptional regulator [Actinocorallia sp. API 0066]|uniref:GntR family transcriptional regulator n=1 Tax=Actinocorallia sp. API 0066 TaxID=2896846 RepID=UPI001E542C49|nr:GntR family transcriptional regulator [Actinocorallia sp. API 0066]MCD0450019.1 GntR family transcriptional regulator [Actinocorallia sp. API 0066]
MSEPGSVRDLAYATLRRRIVEVALKPGERLVERDLAAELNISRIPLREAMRMLAAEGLVVLVPGKGALVSPFTPADVRDLFDVRESLESLAARLAAARASTESVKALADRLAECRAATEARDVPRIAAANAAFHAEIIALAGNPLLTSIMTPLAARTEWLFRLTSSRDPAEQCTEHEVLFDLIASGNADAAAAAAYAHIAAGRAPSLALASTWSEPHLDPEAIARTRRRRKP